jgi:hypothetical protein
MSPPPLARLVRDHAGSVTTCAAINHVGLNFAARVMETRIALWGKEDLAASAIQMLVSKT